MPVSAALSSQLDQLTPSEKAAVADALLRQLDEQWQPTDAQLTELQRRERQTDQNPDTTLPIGEELKRLRR